MKIIFNKFIYFSTCIILASILFFSINGSSPLFGYGPYLDVFFRIGASIGLVLFLIFVIGRINEKQFKIFILLTFLFQILFLISFHWPVYTDTGYVMTMVGRVLEGHLSWYNYFQIYPNNVNIVLFWATILKPFTLVQGINLIQLTSWIQMIVLDVSVCFLSSSLKKINENVAKYFLILTLLYFPIYMYTLMPYSDIFTISLTMVTVALFIKFNVDTKFNLKITILMFLPIICAVLIRQNAVIILIALLITMLVCSNFKRSSKLLIICLGLLMTFGSIKAVNKVQQHEGFVAEKTLANPTISWINMSWNPNTNGEISSDAFVYSNLPKKERQVLIKHDLKNRLKMLGVDGILVHLAKKINFMFAIADSNQDFGGLQIISPFISRQAKVKSINNLIGNIFQPFYIAILFLALCSSIYWLFYSKKTKINQVKNNLLIFSMLSIIGIFSFHVFLWEVRDRYALLLVPFLLLLSAFGLNFLYEKSLHISINFNKKVIYNTLFIGSILLMAISFATNYSLTKNKSVFDGNVYSSGFSLYTEQSKELYTLKPNTEYETKEFTNSSPSNLFNLNFGNQVTKQLSKELFFEIIDVHSNKTVYSNNAYQGDFQPYRISLPHGVYKIKLVYSGNEPIVLPLLQNMDTKNIKGPVIYQNGEEVSGLNMIFGFTDQSTVALIGKDYYFIIFAVYALISILAFLYFNFLHSRFYHRI